MKKALAIFTIFSMIFLSMSAQAHGGKTDKKGCHKEKRTHTRHCH